jgi:hypothetical protein
MSKKSVKFHVESNDYFGTLAAVLSLVRQTPINIEQHAKNLEMAEKDLMLLQREYKIVRKTIVNKNN